MTGPPRGGPSLLALTFWLSKKCKHYVSSSAKAGCGLGVLWRAHEAGSKAAWMAATTACRREGGSRSVMDARRVSSNPAPATEWSSEAGPGRCVYHREDVFSCAGPQPTILAIGRATGSETSGIADSLFLA
jgi:hypothetical protein